jgi:CRP/FNR family cyclic AMP-dependent transcriptional regulator
VRVWAEDAIFAPSSNTLQALIDQAKQCDFGIFIFGADDKVNSKGKRYSAPRDNVVFEGGMFTGTCGICRTIFLRENHERLKMPSDLNGVTYLNFTLKGRAKLPRFGTSIDRIAALIHKLKTV